MGDTEVDEQDLAKALDSVAETAGTYGSGSVPTAKVSDVHGDLTFEETPSTTPGAVASPFTPTPPSDSSIPPYLASNEEPSSLPTPSTLPASDDTGPLASIKQDALVELRPLVDKLNLSSEEKFDTYLLLIRSTDDASLIGPAHDAAKEISDETRRAEALLDIIKEIDYLSHPKTT